MFSPRPPKEEFNSFLVFGCRKDHLDEDLSTFRKLSNLYMLKIEFDFAGV